MPHVFGTLVSNEVKNGRQVTVYDIPALAESTARVRARSNARLKGFSGSTISSVENVGSGSIPGQKVFRVTITSQT